MTRTSVKQDNDYVPGGYDDLYRHYVLGDGRGNSLVNRIVRKLVPYATVEEKEDLTQDVFLRCMDKDVLTLFDPTKSNFGGVIFFVTRTICVNFLDRGSRTPLTGLRAGSLVEQQPDEFEPGVYSLEHLFGSEELDLEGLMDKRSLLTELFGWAQGLTEHPRHKRDESLFPLLQMMADEHDTKECGAVLGVTPSTIHNWMAVIRTKAQEFRAATAS